MAEDLPIYPDRKIRTARHLADLDALRLTTSPTVWDDADSRVARMESAGDVAAARAVLERLAPETLLVAHARLFPGAAGAGVWRVSTPEPVYRGQDCAPPEYIERSIINLLGWLEADSFLELHPIEQAALTITRVVDIWPFETGNITMAVLLANHFLSRNGFDPFFVPPEHMAEFHAILARGITMDTQPLVQAIYDTLWREMKARTRLL
ncbi:MAG TPA: Fic family protein [Terriglobia bacterium]|nr:Fic family protein [Terriglobia bacterium]